MELPDYVLPQPQQDLEARKAAWREATKPVVIDGVEERLPIPPLSTTRVPEAREADQIYATYAAIESDFHANGKFRPTPPQELDPPLPPAGEVHEKSRWAMLDLARLYVIAKMIGNSALANAAADELVIETGATKALASDQAIFEATSLAHAGGFAKFLAQHFEVQSIFGTLKKASDVYASTQAYPYREICLIRTCTYHEHRDSASSQAACPEKRLRLQKDERRRRINGLQNRLNTRRLSAVNLSTIGSDG